MEEQVKVKVDHLTKKFDQLLVLDDISFNVMKGEFLCIVGPTGCGKTTFLNSLTGLYQATSGSILINGKPVDLKKHNVSYIFQEYSTMPWLNVEENVAYGLKLKHTPKDIMKDAGAGGPDGLSGLLPRRAVGQYAPAGGDRPRLRHRAGASADGRALRPAGHRAALPSGG